jgi:O-antigen ligase
MVGVGLSDGGFFPQTWRWTTLAVLAAAGAVLMLSDRVVLSRREVVAVSILLALAGWNLLSWAWSTTPSLAGPEAERALLYASALLGFLVVFETRATLAVLTGLLAASTFLSAWALADHASSTAAPGPLVGPLGYANGAGEVAALGIVVAVGLGLELSGGTRLAVLAPLAVLVPTLALAESSGAALATAAGLAIIALASRNRVRRPAIVVACVAGAIVAAAALIASLGRDNIRRSYWNAALHDYAAHPVLGSGAGSFGRYWALHKTTKLGALDAHSLFLESLAELGLVGLALVVAYLVTVLLAARAGGGRWRAVTTAAFATYVVHTGIDWDWELPATTLPGIVLAGMLLAGGRDERATRLSEDRRLALAVAVAAFAVLALVRLKTAPGT